MTFKDLQKAVQSLAGPGDNQVLQRLKDKPFWLWDPTSHKQSDRSTKGDCCFNHIIGLPAKDGVRKPLFEHERMLYKALLEPGYLNGIPSLHSGDPNNIAHKFILKHLWVKKATGLGITEFMLRFMAWLCLRNDDYRNSQMVIVTGPNQELAIKLIKRMKALFSNGVIFDSKETVLELNNCTIEALSF